MLKLMIQIASFFSSKHICSQKLTSSKTFSTAKTAEVQSAGQLVHISRIACNSVGRGSQGQQRSMCDPLLLLLLLFLSMMILIIGFTCPPTIYFKFITKCGKCYYKMRELFYQLLLQSATGITKCNNFITKNNDYYKVRQYTVSFKQAILQQL